MELKKVLVSRRSICKFKGTAIPDDLLNEMLEAARLAPTAGNAQTHIFGVIKDKTLKEKLAASAGDRTWMRVHRS